MMILIISGRTSDHFLSPLLFSVDRVLDQVPSLGALGAVPTVQGAGKVPGNAPDALEITALADQLFCRVLHSDCSCIPCGDIDTIIKILNKIILNNNSNVQMVEAAYKLLGKCLKWKGDNAGVHDTHMALGHYYEERAEKLTEDDFRSLSIAIDYLQKSIFIYRNCKMTEQAEKAHKKMVFLQSKIPQTMGVIRRRYDVSNLNHYMDESFDGLSFREALLRLLQFTSIRKKEDIKTDVLNALKEHPLSYLFRKKAINSAGQTTFTLKPLDMHDPESDPQILNAHIHQQLLEYETIDGDLFLRIALGIIRNKYDFQISDLDFLILGNPIIPQGRESIFKSAV